MLKKTLLLCGTLSLVLSTSYLMAGFRFPRPDAPPVQTTPGGNIECPVATPYKDSSGNTVTFDQMFGSDAVANMNCVQKRNNVKLVVQVNDFCRDSVPSIVDCAAGRAFALGNMKNMIKDYEITHGMQPGTGYEMVAVVHSGGGHLLRKVVGKDSSGNPIANPFIADVQYLMDRGVKFYFCLNTAAGFIKRGALTQGSIDPQLIDGIEYVPAGLTSIVDFQKRGYTYVQP